MAPIRRKRMDDDFQSAVTFHFDELFVNVGRAGTSLLALQVQGSVDIEDGLIESIALSSYVDGEPDQQIPRDHYLYPFLLEAIHRDYQDRIDATVRPSRSVASENGTYWGRP